MKNKIFVIFGVFVFLLLAAGAGFFFYKYQLAQQEILGIKASGDQTSDVQKLADEVGKLVYLPDEIPQIATVSDVEKLKDQPFFKQAKNGDKVLIYSKAQKAILYDPQTKKIVEIAPITGSSGTSTTSASSSAVLTEVKVVIRNGTNTSGLANKTGDKIKENMPLANLVKKENASRYDYDKTVVVSLNDQSQSAAAKIASFLHTQVSSIPVGESTPENADVLVILGQDQSN